MKKMFPKVLCSHTKNEAQNNFKKSFYHHIFRTNEVMRSLYTISFAVDKASGENVPAMFSIKV